MARAGVVAGRVLDHGRSAIALIARRLAREPRPAPARWQSPSFVLASTLVAALVAIAVLDPHASALFGDATGAWRIFLKQLTALGEGVEILVGSAAILLLCLGVERDGLRPRIRAGLVEVGCAAAFAFAAVAGSGLTASLFKNAFGRTRPEHLAGGNVFELHPFAFDAAHAAFPSGHSTTAGASAMVLALLFPKLGRPILALGVVVALTRILLDAHFPADAIAGFGYGVAFTLTLAQALARRRLVFRRGADGRLAPKRGDGPGRWPDVLAALIARARSRLRVD